MLLPKVVPILLLICSNVFMTLAWYGHLKYPHSTLSKVIIISWLIALFEYCLAVPANRIGHQVYSEAELKTIQEVITLVVFVFFLYFILKRKFYFKPCSWVFFYFYRSFFYI